MGYKDFTTKNDIESYNLMEIPRYRVVAMLFLVEPEIAAKKTIITKYEVRICDNVAKISEVTESFQERKTLFRGKKLHLLRKENHYSVDFTGKGSIELDQYGDPIIINVGETNITVKGKGRFRLIYSYH